MHFAQLGDDDGFQLLFAGEDRLQFGDAVADLREFLEDFVDGELSEAMQLQFEDRVDLRVRETEAALASYRAPRPALRQECRTSSDRA